MHTYQGTNGTNFHFNSDFSGEVTIIGKDKKEIKIPGSDILEFVAYEYILANRVAKLESMSYLGLLDTFDPCEEIESL